MYNNKIIFNVQTILYTYIINREIERLRDQENKLTKDERDEGMRLVDNKSLLDGIQRKINSNETQMRNIREEINSLSNSKSKASLFGGRHMDAVVNRMKNTRFNNPVYGPLGVHVTIKEGYQHWNKAISKAIGNSLNSFIVSDKDDRSTLVDILRSKNYKYKDIYYIYLIIVFIHYYVCIFSI